MRGGCLITLAYNQVPEHLPCKLWSWACGLDEMEKGRFTFSHLGTEDSTLIDFFLATSHIRHRRSRDNCNYDGFANSVWTYSVAAVTQVRRQGYKIFFIYLLLLVLQRGGQAIYGENCSAIWISGLSNDDTFPSSIVRIPIPFFLRV